VRRLRSLQERGKPQSSSPAAKVASEIEDLVEQAFQKTRSIYHMDVVKDVPPHFIDAALQLEHALGEVAKHQVVKLLNAAD